MTIPSLINSLIIPHPLIIPHTLMLSLDGSRDGNWSPNSSLIVSNCRSKKKNNKRTQQWQRQTTVATVVAHGMVLFDWAWYHSRFHTPPILTAWRHQGHDEQPGYHNAQQSKKSHHCHCWLTNLPHCFGGQQCFRVMQDCCKDCCS